MLEQLRTSLGACNEQLFSYDLDYINDIMSWPPSGYSAQQPQVPKEVLVCSRFRPCELALVGCRNRELAALWRLCLQYRCHILCGQGIPFAVSNLFAHPRAGAAASGGMGGTQRHHLCAGVRRGPPPPHLWRQGLPGLPLNREP